jgi:peptidyl-prolyl cis-trans isomerase D
MSAPATSDAAGWVSTDLGSEGYAIVKVNRVLAREAVDEARSRQERDQVSQLWSQAESQAYLKALRSRYKVQILEKSTTAAS